MWRELFVVAEKPRAFKPHTVYRNPAFVFDNSILIESSGRRIEKFLNHLYEINPELIIKFIEAVEIDEDNPKMWGYVFIHPTLKRCITEASWERITDLISATDIITAKLEYDLPCIEKLAEELEQKT